MFSHRTRQLGGGYRKSCMRYSDRWIYKRKVNTSVCTMCRFLLEKMIWITITQSVDSGLEIDIYQFHCRHNFKIGLYPSLIAARAPYSCIFLTNEIIAIYWYIRAYTITNAQIEINTSTFMIWCPRGMHNKTETFHIRGSHTAFCFCLWNREQVIVGATEAQTHGEIERKRIHPTVIMTMRQQPMWHTAIQCANI